MKKIYSLALLMVLSVSAFAQREINFEVTLASPTSSQVINSSTQFTMDAVIKNLGPDALLATDSTTWFMTLSGSGLPITIGGNTGVIWNRWGNALNVNDTFHITFTGLQLTYNQAVDSNRTFCFNAIPNFDGGGVDTIADNALGNNSGCASMLFEASTTNVNQITATIGGVNSASIYPNPAQGNTTVNVNMANTADVYVKVLDVVGRTVLTTEKTHLTKGEHKINVDLSNLQPGLYIYQVNMGRDKSSGKLQVK